MTRRNPLRRRTRLARRTRLRARSRARATHRPVLPPTAYRTLVQHCLAREDGRCWWCRSPRCRPLDPHHVVKRSQGGADAAENIVILGRPCHDRTDAPYAKGRLVIRPLGGEFFSGALVYAADKWTARAMNHA